MKFSTEGIGEAARWLEQFADMGEEAAVAMVEAGADEVKKAWVSEARSRGHTDTGAMIDSIDHAKIYTSSTGAWTVVYPQGKDGKRRNAEKAFYLHYGTSRIKGDHWIDAAEKAAEEPAQKAMEAIFDQKMEG